MLNFVLHKFHAICISPTPSSNLVSTFFSLPFSSSFLYPLFSHFLSLPLSPPLTVNLYPFLYTRLVSSHITVSVGRCTLLSALMQQQIMMLESIIAAYTLSALSLHNARSSERQMMASSW